jgi:peptidoglycan-associated lipoprotein
MPGAEAVPDAEAVPVAEAPAVEPAAAAPEAVEAEAVLLEPAPEVVPDSAGRASQVVFFTVEEYDLDPQAVQVLDNVVAYLRAHPNAAVTVTGHNDGVVEINRSTSSLRAERVRMYLVSRGIVPRRVTTNAVGASQPADTSGTPEALVKNRRVDVVIANGTTAAPE